MLLSTTGSFLFSKSFIHTTKKPRSSPTKPHREEERVRLRASESLNRLSHSFDSQFKHRSQPGGRDFEEERSVARLNFKMSNALL